MYIITIIIIKIYKYLRIMDIKKYWYYLIMFRFLKINFKLSRDLIISDTDWWQCSYFILIDFFWYSMAVLNSFKFMCAILTSSKEFAIIIYSSEFSEDWYKVFKMSRDCLWKSKDSSHLSNFWYRKPILLKITAFYWLHFPFYSLFIIKLL